MGNSVECLFHFMYGFSRETLIDINYKDIICKCDERIQGGFTFTNAGMVRSQ